MKTGDKIIVYSGKHYGREHAVVAVSGSLVTARYEASGDLVVALKCDCEQLTAETQSRGGAK